MAVGVSDGAALPPGNLLRPGGAPASRPRQFVSKHWPHSRLPAKLAALSTKLTDEEGVQQFTEEMVIERTRRQDRLQLVLVLHFCVWMVVSAFMWIAFLKGATDACQVIRSCLQIDGTPYAAWVMYWTGLILGTHALVHYTLVIRDEVVSKVVGAGPGVEDQLDASGWKRLDPLVKWRALQQVRIRRHSSLITGSVLLLNLAVWLGWLLSLPGQRNPYPWPLWFSFSFVVVFGLWLAFASFQRKRSSESSCARPPSAPCHPPARAFTLRLAPRRYEDYGREFAPKLRTAGGDRGVELPDAMAGAL